MIRTLITILALFFAGGAGAQETALPPFFEDPDHAISEIEKSWVCN